MKTNEDTVRIKGFWISSLVGGSVTCLSSYWVELKSCAPSRDVRCAPPGNPTYPTWGKGKLLSSRIPWGYMLVSKRILFFVKDSSVFLIAMFLYHLHPTWRSHHQNLSIAIAPPQGIDKMQLFSLENHFWKN